MWHTVLAQLRFRPRRAVALLAALVVAVTSFAVLTETARAQRLEVNGTVTANARGAYDLLVRPAGARSALETRQNLVSSTALSGLSGGISRAQWQRILSVPGVYAAAPVAVVGYSLPTVTLPVDLSAYVRPGAGSQVWRLDARLVSEGGLTQVPAGSSYVYVTDRSIRHPPSALVPGTLGAEIDQIAPDGSAHPICDPKGVFDTATNRSDAVALACGSTGPHNNVNQPGGASPSATGTDNEPAGTGFVNWTFPYLVEAVDPVQEARLDGLDKAVTSGGYFSPAQRPVTAGQRTAIPVLLADRASTDERLDVAVAELPPAAARSVSAGRTAGQLAQSLPGTAGRPTTRVSFTAQQAYDVLVRGLGQQAAPPPGSAYANDNLSQYLSALPVRYTGTGAALTARPVTEPPLPSPDLGAGQLRDGSDLADTSVRPLTQHRSLTYSGTGTAPMPVLDPVGRFDAGKLSGTRAGLGAVPMETYFAPQAGGADAASVSALKGRPLLPNGNVAGLLSVPPSMITTLDSLPVFSDPGQFTGVTPQLGVDTADPISVVRVRLTGALGTDPLSRERVRLVAQRIHDSTGLDVDVTMGSSSTPVQVVDPAGKFGRPRLTLSEMWSRKGVATTIADAVDRKSLVLFLLVLGVCALFVTGATSAAVRTRRTELGVLACLGWPARRLFGLILAEVVTLGTVAGLIGAALSLPAGRLAGVDVGWQRALLAVPAAVLLAALAALWPAWRSARSHPGEAVRPAVSATARRATITGISSLAWANLRRVPGRTALGAVALAGGVAALVALIGISTAFHGAVAGTLLGDAVTVQVRGSDYAAAAIAGLLGAATIADVLYTNIRDRAAEYALLRATGWPDRSLTRLVLTEAALTAAAGAVLGAGLALAGDAVFTGRLTATLGWTAALAVIAATLVSVGCAALPARALRRDSTAQILAEEA
ncbi:FtsX-like permease family protein [Streptomyces polygonati]|uniref:FtsX-like permease family protein n=1 Tax=Streptomyces polygonati TaxID=1617087 RepID=A0ABV8HVA8_9ACTN